MSVVCVCVYVSLSLSLCLSLSLVIIECICCFLLVSLAYFNQRWTFKGHGREGVTHRGGGMGVIWRWGGCDLEVGLAPFSPPLPLAVFFLAVCLPRVPAAALAAG